MESRNILEFCYEVPIVKSHKCNICHVKLATEREKANAAVKWQGKFVGFMSNGLPDYLFEINDIHPIGQTDGYICSITIKKGNIMSNIIGTNAGIIWKYLDKHGPTTVAKLIRETEVDEKSIQRGIGWLAQEGKVTIELVNRAETIALK